MLKEPIVISGMIFVVIDTAIYLYYCITLFNKLRIEKPLLQNATAVYLRRHVRNFLYEVSFLYLPLVFIYEIVCFVFAALMSNDTVRWMLSAGYIVYTVLVLVYILTISLVGDTYLVFIVKDSIVFMSQVIKLNTIAAFDFNASRKHIYVNFINDEGQKDMLKLRNIKSLYQFFRDNFSEELFIL
jgi:hypothetical protein